jgi:hypothetical protein
MACGNLPLAIGARGAGVVKPMAIAKLRVTRDRSVAHFTGELSWKFYAGEGLSHGPSAKIGSKNCASKSGLSI